MFPLTHLHSSLNLLSPLSPTEEALLIIGGLLPDIISGMGLDRHFGHTGGVELFNLAKDTNIPALPLAMGALIHGTEPKGIDQYADEEWQDYGNGWCFKMCVPYMEDIKVACNLPDNIVLWKSHNFIEMACELIIAEQSKIYEEKINSAINNMEARSIIYTFLGENYQISQKSIDNILNRLNKIFVLADLTPKKLATAYSGQLEYRHQIFDYDIHKMSKVIEQIHQDIPNDFKGWQDFTLPTVKNNLENYLNQYLNLRSEY